MAGETDLVGMLIANPPAFYGLSLFVILVLGGLIYWNARKSF